MASWPENPRLIGTQIPRVDGLAKASGRAKYPSDVRPEGTLFGVMVYSPQGRAQVDGKPDEAMDAADATIEATYSAPVITHVCLETHGLTARWEGNDKIVAWASTQNVLGVAGELAQKFKVPQPNVTVHTEVM